LAWQASLDVLPSGVNERPGEMRQRAEILKRMGRTAEAQHLNSTLAAIGYRQMI
jgi:hypothetical protein